MLSFLGSQQRIDDIHNNSSSNVMESTENRYTNPATTTSRCRGISGNTCSICLEDFQDGDIICQSPNCCHIFHWEGCMSEWLLGNDGCPCCRTPYLVTTNDDEKNKWCVQPLSRVPRSVSQNSAAASATSATRYVEAEMFIMDDFPPWLVIGW
jgi:hypothetical protein